MQVFHFAKLFLIINDSIFQSVFRLIFLSPTGFTGNVMFGLLIVMWICSTREIRDKYYNLFLASHHLFLVFFALMYFHPTSNVIKYQGNLETHPTKCELMELLKSENYLKFCIEEPIFTAGNKLVCFSIFAKVYCSTTEDFHCFLELGMANNWDCYLFN